MLYMVTYTPNVSIYIPYMDPMGTTSTINLNTGLQSSSYGFMVAFQGPQHGEYVISDEGI